MLSIFLAILPVFFLIVIGYLIKRIFENTEGFWKVSDKFVYYLFFPALLIFDVSKSHFSAANTFYPLSATIVATLLIAAVLVAIQWFFRFENPLFSSVFQGGIRYNSYVFIALSQTLFGEQGVALSGVFIAYMIVLTNLMSVIAMNHYGHGSKKSLSGAITSVLKNPLILAALFGILLNVCQIHIRGPMKQLFVYLGNAATPLSLMSVGAGLVFSMHIKKVFALCYSSFLKLVAMPVVTFFLLKFFAATGTTAHVALLYASMPCAGNAYILARQMGGDSETMASIITWTTVLSVVSITFLFGVLVSY